MPPCCHATRRQVLRWGAVVAASPLLGALADVEKAYGATRVAVPMNLELVTLTETSAVLTWYTGDPTRLDGIGRPSPAPADTEVLLGTHPARMRPVVQRSTTTPYHYVELHGLEPGQRYYYLARSRGVPATPAPFFAGNPVGTPGLEVPEGGPFSFRTPEPPPGRHLFSIALCNDLHLGETVSGLATSVGGVELPPGFSQRPGEPPYPVVMARALAREARDRGADLLIANGDVSSSAEPDQLRDARTRLDAFGDYRRDYLVTRGNHDRVGDDGDEFADVFFARRDTWFATQKHGLRIIGLDTYDKHGDGGDTGYLSPAQMRFVKRTLRNDPDRPTLVVGHHPVTEVAVRTTVPPIGFDMNERQARELEQAYGSAPGVFLHHSAHTHRNKRTTAPDAPGVIFQEVAAVKEYPGGFHLLRVFSGGYALNFYKFRDPLAREWAERTRQEYFDLYPYYTAGTLRDRNSVVRRDFSGLTRPRITE